MMSPTLKAIVAAPMLALLFQPSFSTAMNANLRASFTSALRFGAPRFATASLPTCDTNNKGALALDSTTNTFKYCNGTSWVESAGGGAGVSSGVQGFATGSLPTCAAGTTNLVVYDTTLQKLLICNGTSYQAKVGTTVLYSTATAVTTTGTSIETVATYALPAGFLDTDAQSIEVDWSITCAANANNKTPTIVFGATTVATVTPTCNNTAIFQKAIIWRRTATTQTAISENFSFNNSGGSAVTSPAETLANSITILGRLTTPTSAGDATMQAFRVISTR